MQHDTLQDTIMDKVGGGACELPEVGIAGPLNPSGGIVLQRREGEPALCLQ